MFAIARLGGDEDALSFKATPQAFAILLESREFVPAPYLARAEWVALGPDCALPQADLHAYLAQAHRTVFAKLPRKMRAELSGQGGWQTKISRNG